MTGGEDAPRVKWVEASDAAQNPTVCPGCPTAEEDLVPNVCSAKEENLCLRFRHDGVFSSFSILRKPTSLSVDDYYKET